jgi:hypothetical protein
LAGALFAVVALRVLGPIHDPDTYWHVEAGRLLFRTWDFVTPDPWGAAASLPWIRNQWLPQLAMSGMVDRFGLAGLAWLHAAAAATVVLAVWWTCRRRASMLLSALITAIALIGMLGSLSPRPQLVTFALTAVFVDAWLRTAADGRPRWWLVPVAWVWAGSHGMWFLGGVIGLVVLAGMALDGTHPRKALGRAGLVAVLSLVVGAITPVGPRLLASPFQVSDVTSYIQEWQPVGLTNPSLLAVLLLAAVPVIAGLRSRTRMPWHTLLLLGLALTLALLYARTIAIAAVIVAPLAAQTVRGVLPRERVTRQEGVVTATLAALSLVVAGSLAPGRASQPGSGPNDLSPAIAALPSGTILCNEQIDGGWLIYEHPNVRVTMDTRVEIYSVEHIESHLGFIRASPGWQDYPKRLGCQYALLSQKDPVVEALTTRADWTVAASGVDRVLLKAPTG